MKSESIHSIRRRIANNYTVTALKTAIVIWAIIVIAFVVFFVDDPWLLTAILLYEVLP